MAHVVLALVAPEIRQIYTLVLEGEDHVVTAPDDFWGVLAVLRSSLHSVVVVYSRDEVVHHLLPVEERIAAVEASREALGRHRYVATTWSPVPLPPRLATLEDPLGAEMLVQPFRLEELDTAVRRAAERFPTEP